MRMTALRVSSTFEDLQKYEFPRGIRHCGYPLQLKALQRHGISRLSTLNGKMFSSVNGLMVRILPFQGRGPGSIPG